jgi:hypothetical protein
MWLHFLCELINDEFLKQQYNAQDIEDFAPVVLKLFEDELRKELQKNFAMFMCCQSPEIEEIAQISFACKNRPLLLALKKRGSLLKNVSKDVMKSKAELRKIDEKIDKMINEFSFLEPTSAFVTFNSADVFKKVLVNMEAKEDCWYGLKPKYSGAFEVFGEEPILTKAP